MKTVLSRSAWVLAGLVVGTGIGIWIGSRRPVSTPSTTRRPGENEKTADDPEKPAPRENVSKPATDPARRDEPATDPSPDLATICRKPWGSSWSSKDALVDKMTPEQRRATLEELLRIALDPAQETSARATAMAWISCRDYWDPFLPEVLRPHHAAFFEMALSDDHPLRNLAVEMMRRDASVLPDLVDRLLHKARTSRPETRKADADRISLAASSLPGARVLDYVESEPDADLRSELLDSYHFSQVDALSPDVHRRIAGIFARGNLEEAVQIGLLDEMVRTWSYQKNATDLKPQVVGFLSELRPASGRVREYAQSLLHRVQAFDDPDDWTRP